MRTPLFWNINTISSIASPTTRHYIQPLAPMIITGMGFSNTLSATLAGDVHTHKYTTDEGYSQVEPYTVQVGLSLTHTNTYIIT